MASRNFFDSSSDESDSEQIINNKFRKIARGAELSFTDRRNTSDVDNFFRRISAQTQSGSGVTTRRQARLTVPIVEAKNSHADFDTESSSISPPTDVSRPTNVDRTESPIPSTSTAAVSEDNLEPAVVPTEPPPPLINPLIYNQDTKVAENEFLKAYVHKAFHQRQKIFQ